MKPVALLVNDLHIDKDNIVEYEKNWNEMLQVCEENNVSKIIIGGDIFTTTNAQTLAPCLTVQRCFHAAASKGIKMFVASGNHDKIDKDSTESWVDLYSDCPNLLTIPTYQIYDLGECHLAVFAYFLEEKDSFLTYLGMCRKELERKGISEKDCILYVHAGIHGALGNFDVPSEAPQEYFDGFKAVLCGHYHNRTHIADTEIEYIGSSRAHNFGEDEEKGYTLIYADGSTKFVKNQANIRYVTDDVKFSELKDWERKYDDQYKVRLRINCTAAEAETVDKQELIERGANKIEFETEKIKAVQIESSDLEEKFSNADLQFEYQSWCNDKAIDSALGVEYLKKAK